MVRREILAPECWLCHVLAVRKVVDNLYLVCASVK